MGPTVPSPKTYLRTLQEKLSRESSLSPKTHTHHRSRTAVKKHLFEPAFVKKGSNETDSSGVSSTHSLSSATDSDLELQLPTTSPHSGKPKAPWHPPGSRLSPYGGHIDTLTASLQEINGKLWQVLDRLNDQTEFSHLQQLARHGIPPSAAPTPLYPPTGHSHFAANQRKLPLHSSDRYAGWTSCHDCVLSVVSSHTILPSTSVSMHPLYVRTGVCQTHTTAHSCMDILSPCAGHSEAWAWCGVPHWVALLKTARTNHSYPCSLYTTVEVFNVHPLKCAHCFLHYLCLSVCLSSGGHSQCLSHHKALGQPAALMMN